MQINPEVLRRGLPVEKDALRRRHDEDIFLALLDEPLDGAQAGECLAGAGAVGDERAMAFGGRVSLFDLEHVLLLFLGEDRKGVANVLQIARLGGDLLGRLLLRELGREAYVGFFCNSACSFFKREPVIWKSRLATLSASDRLSNGGIAALSSGFSSR